MAGSTPPSVTMDDKNLRYTGIPLLTKYLTERTRTGDKASKHRKGHLSPPWHEFVQVLVPIYRDRQPTTRNPDQEGSSACRRTDDRSDQPED